MAEQTGVSSLLHFTCPVQVESEGERWSSSSRSLLGQHYSVRNHGAASDCCFPARLPHSPPQRAELGGTKCQTCLGKMSPHENKANFFIINFACYLSSEESERNLFQIFLYQGSNVKSSLECIFSLKASNFRESMRVCDSYF